MIALVTLEVGSCLVRGKMPRRHSKCEDCGESPVCARVDSVIIVVDRLEYLLSELSSNLGEHAPLVEDAQNRLQRGTAFVIYAHWRDKMRGVHAIPGKTGSY